MTPPWSRPDHKVYMAQEKVAEFVPKVEPTFSCEGRALGEGRGEWSAERRAECRHQECKQFVFHKFRWALFHSAVTGRQGWRFTPLKPEKMETG